MSRRRIDAVSAIIKVHISACPECGTNEWLMEVPDEIARKPGVIVYYLVPILAPGRPAPPRGKQSGSYAIFLQHTPDGWKIRAWATYWMYFQRPYGTAAGMRFRAAYRKEAERLGLRPRAGKAAVIAGAR